ncbi:hypothetical protein BY458DRAFT_533256 [Sporodiniella umbellata]|nr:hypothetical protein BY458DRAFT_533256 [Sporodiniella umbellata]
MIVLITGGTCGLGRLTAKKMIDRGHTVIITGRSQSALDRARKWIVSDESQQSLLYELILDLEKLDGIALAIEHLGLRSIDVVVHNAGAVAAEFRQIAGAESTVFCNGIGPLYLHECLLPWVEKSTCPERRILFVVSSLHDPDIKGGSRSEISSMPQDVQLQDLQGSFEHWHPMRYYRLSKLASVWNAYLAAQKTEIPVLAFCPGFVPSTDLNRHSSFLARLFLKYVLTWFSFTVTEETATDDYVYYITQPGLETGKYYRSRKLAQSSKDSLDKAKQESYWTFAQEQINKKV